MRITHRHRAGPLGTYIRSKRGWGLSSLGRGSTPQGAAGGCCAGPRQLLVIAQVRAVAGASTNKHRTKSHLGIAGVSPRKPSSHSGAARPVNLLSTACKFTAGADAVALNGLHAGHDDARPVQANPC